MKYDLHTHTTFCDGKNTPEEMVAAAFAAGVRYYVVEQDDNFAVDPMSSARTSFRYLADKVFNEPARPEPLPR